jgi:hypothetical protein
MAKYQCTNFSNCSEADNYTLFELPESNPICPECQSTLSSVGGKSGNERKWIIIAAIISVIITIAIILYFIFHEETYSVVITSPNTEQGKIVSIGTKKTKTIDCSPLCTQEYSAKTSLKLIAQPNKDFEFDSWMGDCEKITTNECTLTINSDKKVGVIFKASLQLPPPNQSPTNDMATIKILLSGEGAITSEDKKINCDLIDKESVCKQEYPKNTEITLTATAKAGHQIRQWGEACEQTENNQCIIKLDTDKEAMIVFEKIPVAGKEEGISVEVIDQLEETLKTCSNPPNQTCISAILEKLN